MSADASTSIQGKIRESNKPDLFEFHDWLFCFLFQWLGKSSCLQSSTSRRFLGKLDFSLKESLYKKSFVGFLHRYFHTILCLHQPTPTHQPMRTLKERAMLVLPLCKSSRMKDSLTICPAKSCSLHEPPLVSAPKHRELFKQRKPIPS